MLRSVWDSKPAIFFIFGLLLSTLSARAQEAPVILHDGIDCIVLSQHATIRAEVEPSTDIRVVRLYFRSALYSTFYFIEMSQEESEFRAVLPRPKAETPRVVYYIEVITNDFNNARTQNFEPEVREENECDDDDVVAGYFLGDPDIIIGITQAGLPAIPPGFEAVGLAGGGISRTTGVLIGGAGAGAVAGIVAAGGGSEEGPAPETPTTSTTTPGATTTVITTTTTSTPGTGGNPVACFETDPAPPRILVNGAVRFDASCSKGTSSQSTGITRYQWDFGDGTSGREGRVVQRVFQTPGTFTVTLTVTNEAGLQDQTSKNVIVGEPSTTTVPGSTTTTTAGSGEANLSVTLTANANTPSATQITYQLTVFNAGPQSANGVQATINFPAQVTAINSFSSSVGTPPCVPYGIPTSTCAFPAGAMGSGTSWILTFIVTASSGSFLTSGSVTSSGPPDPNPENNSASVITNQAQRAHERAIASSLTSALESPPPDGRLKGQVTINAQQTDPTDNSSPFRHPYSGLSGENTVEALLVSGEAQEGRWRFDFRESANFEPGSIRVDSGQVISIGPQEVVFRVTGTAGLRIRFRYRLER